MTAPQGNGQLDFAPGALQKLADKHADAQASVSQATPLGDGVAAKVSDTHGSMGSRMAAAIRSTQEARKSACAIIETTSGQYEDSLRSGAWAFYKTDHMYGDQIQGTMPPS
jgi:hypothetical protein